MTQNSNSKKMIESQMIKIKPKKTSNQTDNKEQIFKMFPSSYSS